MAKRQSLADAAGPIYRADKIRIDHPSMPKQKGWRERYDEELLAKMLEPAADDDLPWVRGGRPRNLPDDLPDIGNPSYEEYRFRMEEDERRRKQKSKQ